MTTSNFPRVASHAARVDLFLYQQAVDTTTPAGKAMFQMLGVFSEFERAMIQSRVKAGMARIKAGAPTKSGKPVGRPTISPAVERDIREHLNVGTGMLKTADEGRFGRHHVMTFQNSD